MPEKKLFEQTLKNTLSLDDRLALGVPNQEGCDNMKISALIRETGLNLIKRFVEVTSDQTFTVPNNSVITGIHFFGAGTVSATKTDNGDLVPETDINGNYMNPMYEYFRYSGNITIGVSGQVTCVIMYIYNLY